MRKVSFSDIAFNNNIKLYMKGDQAYTYNLQPSVTIFPGSYFILRFALCRYRYIKHETYYMYYL